MPKPKKRILCIDGHWSGLICRKRLLEQNGYQVLEATDSDEGLELFLTHAVDAVVLDYKMPGTSGDVVAMKMKKAKAHVPILLLSAYGPLPAKKLASVDSFMTKSQESEVLLPSLQNLLAARSKPHFFRWLDQWRGRIPAAKA